VEKHLATRKIEMACATEQQEPKHLERFVSLRTILIQKTPNPLTISHVS
jgi:hypothetical protein